MAAYGGKYNTTPQTLNLTIGGTAQIPLASTMPPFEVDYTPANGIMVTKDGNYEINYFTSLSVAVGATVTIAVRLNGTNIPGATVSRVLSVGVGSQVNGSFMISLPAGSVIDMTVSALIAVGVTLGTGVNATLSVKKLD